MWRSRTFWRLFGSFGLVWLASIAVLGWVVENRVERHQLEQIESSLRAKALLAAEMVRDRRADDAPQLQRRIESLRPETGTRLTLMTSDGTVIADSDKDPRRYRLENHLDRPEVQAAQQVQFSVSRRRHSSTVDQDMMYVALRTDDPRGAVAFVRVALPLDAIQAQVAELRWIIWSAAAVAAIAGMLLAFWLGRRITRPLKELTAGAARIAAGEHRHRVFALGRDEMGTLARAFNTMSERLGEQFAQLEEDRAQLRAVLSGMVEGVIAIDAEERIVFANQCAGRLLRFADDTAVGRELWA